MNNKQPYPDHRKGATKPNPTRTYSQTRRPVRSKSEIARRIFMAKCIIFLGLVLVLGGGVYLLCRSGLFSKKTASPTEVVLSSLSSVTSEAETTPPEDTTPEVTETTALPGDLTGYYVILDPGHGGWDRGTAYPYNSDQNEEPTYTIKIANLLAEELRGRGATVYITRTDDEYYSLYYRIAETHLICMDIAKEKGILPFSEEKEQDLRGKLEEIKRINDNSFDKGGMGFMAGTGVGEDLKALFEMEYQLPDVVFISIHLNADYDESTHEPVDHHGIEVTYVTDDSVNTYESKESNRTAGAPVRDAYNGRPNERNLQFCQTLYDYITKDTPNLKSNMDKPVYTANWAVTRKIGLTGTLLEFGFISHETDRTILQDEAALKVVCSSIGDSLEEYFKKI